MGARDKGNEKKKNNNDDVPCIFARLFVCKLVCVLDCLFTRLLVCWLAGLCEFHWRTGNACIHAYCTSK